jgi:hypothetical protein
LREVGLIDFETQNGVANVVYRLADLAILSKGKEQGLPQGFEKGSSEVDGKVLCELSKVKTTNLNLNKNQEKVCHSTGSQTLYQEFQNLKTYSKGFILQVLCRPNTC